MCISHCMSLCKGTSLRNSNNLVTSSDLCIFLKSVPWPKKRSKTGTELVFQMDSMRYLNNFFYFCFACLFSPQACPMFLPLAIQAFLLKTCLSLKLRDTRRKFAVGRPVLWALPVGDVCPLLEIFSCEFLSLKLHVSCRDETLQAERCLIPLDLFNS